MANAFRHYSFTILGSRNIMEKRMKVVQFAKSNPWNITRSIFSKGTDEFFFFLIFWDLGKGNIVLVNSN